MSYKSVLVNIDVDGPVIPIVKVAIDIARSHDARLIGLCGADAPLPMAGVMTAEAWQQMRDNVEKRFTEVRAEFDRLTAGSVRAEWRQSLTSPTHAVVRAAQSADLIVMSASEGAATGDSYRHADPASVVLRAGRPVLVVRDKVEQFSAERIVVAWKDTREARRAVADAVPLLVAAGEVTVVTVAAEADQRTQDGLNYVVAFLAEHGIKSTPRLIESHDEYIELFDFIDRSDTDLVVSGAYGHSRLREWAFGGVTRAFLDEARLNRFLSS
jgi:nucleotide-binding universal stress UspA family protein